MLSDDLENLIEQKRRELENEKAALGLSENNRLINSDVEKIDNTEPSRRVQLSRARALSKNNETPEDESEEKDIPPDLERYIRRYLGLPVMLKAGEYSPNNPLIRGERPSGDVLLGLGEYERRRNTLRKIRQKQYKEYLDQQAKIKQEEREKAERERKEREEKERLAEERVRERERLELDRRSPERRRASFTHPTVSGANNAYTTKVDTGVQVDDRHTPLSVAVQTDENDLFSMRNRVSLHSKQLLTQAERELSPRTVADVKPATWHWPYKEPVHEDRGRRRSYGDFDARTSSISRDNKQTYRPSILDADVISLRNLQAEKEAAARRQFYQQELRNQIEEQQRIREERKNREKMLEQAEMRRLEQQLRSLKVAQETELDRHRDFSAQIKRNSAEYDMKRTSLQREIDTEQRKLTTSKLSHTPQSDNYYSEKPYSTNVPESSIFSPNYDLDSYLRKNLNPSKESLLNFRKYHSRQDTKPDMSKSWHERGNEKSDWYEKRQIHDDIHEKMPYDRYETENKLEGMKMYDRGDFNENTERHETYKDDYGRNEKFDALPIPVLRHSPKHNVDEHQENVYKSNEDLSQEMQLVDNKWKVPAVQKNILKSLHSEGRNINILTQLGSIRRQLQLEQMKLDKLKQSDV
ncbi:unnamed protein product [Leptosia nina]|uniref:CSPP1 n=1 Tax=Leptosia nina TaxID=320188 RepID=A0AAV1JGU2_9NEOP